MRIRVVSFLACAIAASVAAFVPAGEAPTPAKEAGSAAVCFSRDVSPMIDRLGCNASACHGSAAGKGGFKLSMFGADPKADYEALTRYAAGRRINKVDPTKSLFLLKATKTIDHGGGQKFAADSPEYKMLLDWVAGGAPWAAGKAPELVRIEVSPAKQVLDKGASHSFTATAVYADDTREDVTRAARFQSLNEAIAQVDQGGKVTAKEFGQTDVVATYMRKPAVARIVVPQPLPSGFPDVAPNNKVDELVFAKLKELGVPPSEPCTDEVFLRRVYLDVIGTLPTADQAREFLEDKDPKKRARLIDKLLASEEFADFWALKWGDLFRIKSEFPSNLWPNAVQAYHHWVRASIAQNKPYDQFATELLTSTGSNFRVPPVNYYRAFLKKEPQNIGEVTALIFMGARIGCARCHGHPTEDWGLDDNLGMAAFFPQVRYKPTTEWKEEIVYLDPDRTLRHPLTSEVVPPTFPGGETAEIEPGEDARAVFAEWLTAPDNPWFAKNIVNRTWYWLLGRGIIHDADDIRPTNPPSNPELLAYLEDELVGHNYDLKHVYRLILNSKTYQLSSKAGDLNRWDKANFSHYYVKRLGAETLLDAIGQVTERWDTYRSIIPEPFIVMPEGFRATHLADGSIGLPFLEMFGRPPRDTAFESDRDLELSMRQTLHMLNSGDVQNKINGSPRLRQFFTDKKSDEEIVEEIYLSTLSRLPTDEEKKNVTEYLSRDPKLRTQSVQDLVWAIFNTKEFLFNH